MKILLCEDHEVERKAIQLAIEGEAVEWVCASDGRKAMQILESSPEFDLIITDIHMPYHNGDDILHLVRETQKRSTPVIMVSSDDAEEVVKMALRLGVNDFISKPIDPIVVRKKLMKYIRR